LVCSELSRAQVDVRGSAADALAIGSVEAGEHADLPELIRGHHACLSLVTIANATATEASGGVVGAGIEARRLQAQEPALGRARRTLGCGSVVRLRRRRLTGKLEQMRADRVEPVVPRKRLVDRVEQRQSGFR